MEVANIQSIARQLYEAQGVRVVWTSWVACVVADVLAWLVFSASRGWASALSS
jgi:hypothetical protein